MFRKCNIPLYFSGLLALISFLWVSTAYSNQIGFSEPAHCSVNKIVSEISEDNCTEGKCCEDDAGCENDCKNSYCNSTNTHFSFIAPIVMVPEHGKEIRLKQKTAYTKLFYSSFYHTIWQPPKIV